MSQTFVSGLQVVNSDKRKTSEHFKVFNFKHIIGFAENTSTTQKKSTVLVKKKGHLSCTKTEEVLKYKVLEIISDFSPSFKGIVHQKITILS